MLIPTLRELVARAPGASAYVKLGLMERVAMDAWPDCRALSRTTIGWGDLGPLAAGMSSDAVGARLHAWSPNDKAGRRAQNARSIETFLAMQPGTVVFAFEGISRCHGVGVVTGPYAFDPTPGRLQPHYFPVRWLRARPVEVPLPAGHYTNTCVTLRHDLAAPVLAAYAATEPPAPECPGPNRVLYGPPGTGKTWQARRAAVRAALDEPLEEPMDRLHALQKQKRIRFVTFHPSFSYEDFVEGIRPRPEAAAGEPPFTVRDGVFLDICVEAERALRRSLDEVEPGCGWLSLETPIPTLSEAQVARAPRYVLVIDEINRGNVARIFGELITLLEPDKRLGGAEAILVTLPYSGRDFGVPPNLHVIGTMNTSDRSIAQMDVALRRRFEFEEVAPDFSVVRAGWPGGVPAWLECAIDGVEALNGRILRERDLGSEKCLGHAYLMGPKDEAELVRAFRKRIFPLLVDYCFGDFDLLRRVVGPAEAAWLDADRHGFRADAGVLVGLQALAR